MSSKASRSGRSGEERRATTNTPTVPLAPIGMVRATVSQFDERRGSGAAILTNAGRRVRIPWSALRAAGVAVLSVGDIVFVQVDYFDRNRAEAIFVP